MNNNTLDQIIRKIIETEEVSIMFKKNFGRGKHVRLFHYDTTRTEAFDFSDEQWEDEKCVFLVILELYFKLTSKTL